MGAVDLLLITGPDRCSRRHVVVLVFRNVVALA